MKLKTLTASILLSTLPTAGVFAAALDRSGQSISAFLQPGNYFEAGISVLDPDVSGSNSNGKISDMGEDYYFPSAALKIQATNNISLGLLYDQPFGADAYYSDGVINSALGPRSLNGTNVEVKTNNLTALVGFQPNENLNLYGGATYQDVRGNITLTSLGYSANFKKDDGFGWLVGAAYQIPEIALKLSLTYRSEVDHELETQETVNLPAPVNGLNPFFTGASEDTKLSTPQSVNLDFQTGIMENTVAFANVRWVEWGGYGIDIDKFRKVTGTLVTMNPSDPTNASKGQNIIDYKNDQWSANLGVGRKLNDQWSGALSVGWDSGAGNPVTALGPTDGYWNVGLNAQFSPTPSTFIGAGVKYFWLGDAEGKSVGTTVGNFDDNTALAYGLKIGYRF